MASITLIFKNGWDFAKWATEKGIDFLANSNIGANSSTINNELSSGKSLLFTDKGTFDNWTNMRLTYGSGIVQGINSMVDARQAWHLYQGNTAAARGCLQFTHSGNQTMMQPKRTVLR